MSKRNSLIILCSGHGGFRTVIGDVAGKVWEYNRDVEIGNNDIKKPIETLLGQINEDTKWYKDLGKIQFMKLAVQKESDEAVIEVARLLKECLASAEAFNDTLHMDKHRDIKNAIEDLNSELSVKVKSAISSVKHETKRLKTLSEKGKQDLAITTKLIKTALEEVGKDVNHEIELKVKRLVERVIGVVNHIKERLDGLNDNLKDYVTKLSDWIKAAEKVRRQADLKVAEIVGKLNGVGDQEREGDKNAITKAAGELQKRAESLREKAFKAKTQVKTLVSQALKEVAAFDRAVRTVLKDTRDKIQGAMQTYVKTQLLGDITKRVNEIIKGPGGSDGLEQTVKVFKAYAQQFGEDGEHGFESVVEEWIKGILDEEPVKGWLKKYAEEPSNLTKLGERWDAEKSVFKEPTIRGIAITIRDEIKKHFSPSFRTIEISDKNSIDDYMNAVQIACGVFANTLGEKLKEGAGSISSSDMAKAINKHLAAQDTHSHNLSKAVYSTLHQLVSIANKTSEAAGSFTGENDGTESDVKIVDTSLGVAKQLGLDLGTATTPGKPVTAIKPEDTAHPFKLSDSVDARILGILEAEVGEDDSGSGGKGAMVKKVKDTNMGHYGTYIKQEEDALRALASGEVNIQPGGPEQNKLPNAVKRIEAEVLQEGTLKNVEDNGDGNDTFHKNTFANMLESVKTSLNKFTDKVRDLVNDSAKSSVHAYLSELDNMLQGTENVVFSTEGLHDHSPVRGLQKIKDDLSTLQNDLETGPIAWAKTFIDSDAENLRTETVETLEDIVNKRVKSAISDITHQTNKNYVTSIEDFLWTFVMKTTEVLQPLPNMIKYDLEKGVKGFMKKFHNKFIEKITAIRTYKFTIDAPQMPLIPAALSVKLGLVDFFDHLKTQKGFESDFRKVAPCKNALAKMLGDLASSKHFDHEFSKNLNDLDKTVSVLNLTKFGDGDSPLLLNALSKGFPPLVEEFKKPYVSTYSQQKFTGALLQKKTAPTPKPAATQLNPGIDQTLHASADAPTKALASSPSPQNSIHPTTSQESQSPTKPETELTPEGRNCAKVCLTILEMMRYDFNDLLSGCSESASIQINLYNNQKLGRWFRKRGFKVNSDSGKQHGELQDKQSMRGTEIKTLLNKNIVGASGIEVLKMWKQEWMKEQDEKKSYSKQQGGTLITHKTVYNTEHINLLDIIRFLKVPLGAYYRSSHHFLPPKPRSPSNVYQMLQWLLGLYFNPMYQKLEAHIAQLFAGLKAQYKLEHPHLDVTVPDDLKKYIHSPLSSEQLTTVLRNVCLYSEDTLTAFLGRGHADGRYAVEFYTNSDQLLYPTSVGTCFDMLVDTSFRVYNQLRFVYKQCNNGTKSGGWNDCWYGQHVGGSSWNCNTKQCANQNCPQIANQKTNQSADQRCDQHPICGVKSPLQSFLEDGLPGFLPHSFKTPGCKLTCTVSNHFGKPCLTPMGFADISNVASRTQKGEDLKKLIEQFCGPHSYLRRLCIIFNCLLRRAPQTLGDMFAFYYHLLNNWNNSGEHRKTAFDKAVNDANFGEVYTDLMIASIENSRTHDHREKYHDKGDLFSLTDCVPKSTFGLPCGPYLQALSLDIQNMYSKHNASQYLSWIVYLTETFYDLLKKLYDDCCAKCDKKGARCYDKCCDETCGVNAAYTAEEPSKKLSTSKHTSECHSIVACQNMHPTLYKYGFTFGSPFDLSGKSGTTKQRSCRDFCRALEKVVKDGSLLYNLVHKYIPDYIFEIRSKFIWTLLSLWSLSLLYLLHIAVVRLDVLRIRSHLRSPASHRIAAQSLLAAARVRALANVKYFSP
ncbi:hypothetical protein, conserved [Babesia ovata]|uniref:Uncharacterized protein n=1 Tax=Babesia ovata TaxID=189622 RepID=A0A2H6KKB6_9APIC|nr:uncharacterized protein BOVATA_049200 [Babesia ovata]GBE63427.1 hypothetical protein, conserved [Babesia ovata]